MKLLLLALTTSLSLPLASFASTQATTGKGAAFICSSTKGADDWYVEGIWGAETLTVDQDELGQSTYRLDKVTRDTPHEQRYVFNEANGNGGYLLISRDAYEPKDFHARLFAKDSKDPFDHVYFTCKFPQAPNF